MGLKNDWLQILAARGGRTCLSDPTDTPFCLTLLASIIGRNFDGLVVWKKWASKMIGYKYNIGRKGRPHVSQ
jgi:hypothetical protein